MTKLKKYLFLFLNFFKVGLFTFGGGYAMISVISHELVDKRKYIDNDEFMSVVAIAESTPGPIAINSATYIGYRVGGVIGSLIASIAVSLPSFIIIYVISLFFEQFIALELVKKAFMGIQCGVAVIIIAAAFKLFKNIKKNIFSYLLVFLSAATLLCFDLFSIHISSIYFVLVGGAIGFALYYRKNKKPADKPDISENNNLKTPLLTSDNAEESVKEKEEN